MKAFTVSHSFVCCDLSPSDFLLSHDVTGSLQVQQIGFLSHWDPYAVISLEAVVLCIVTQWSGSGGTEANLSGRLASISAMTLLVGSSDLKNRPQNVL